MFFFFAILLCNHSTFACTVISSSDNDIALVGNNCDTIDAPYDNYFVEQGADEVFSSIYFGSKFNRQCGINQHLLFYADASIPRKDLGACSPNNTFNPQIKFMQESATVDDVVRLVHDY